FIRSAVVLVSQRRSANVTESPISTRLSLVSLWFALLKLEIGAFDRDPRHSLRPTRASAIFTMAVRLGKWFGTREKTNFSAVAAAGDGRFSHDGHLAPEPNSANVNQLSR